MGDLCNDTHARTYRTTLVDTWRRRSSPGYIHTAIQLEMKVATRGRQHVRLKAHVWLKGRGGTRRAPPARDATTFSRPVLPRSVPQP
jgi:hypothetical protein